VSVVATPRPTSASTGSLSVSYIARSDNGSAVTSFRVLCVSTNGGVPGGAVHSGSDAAPITVSKLTTGRTYVCGASATNVRGTGLPSRLSDPVTVGAPASPTNVTAVRSGAGQLQVTFKAGANNGSRVLVFGVECDTDDGGASGTLLTGAGGGTVTGLTPGDSYTCFVVAVNARGASAPSAPTTPVIA
jgi:hypothetical protein